MKKHLVFFLSAALFSAPVFTSCSDDDDEPSVKNIITFESAELGEAGYIDNAPYSEADYTFSNFYNKEWFSWNGFAVSNNTDMETEGFMNQYSVYAKSGANNSKNFAVAYFSEYNAALDEEYPTISRADKKYFNLNSAELCLTTYTYLSVKNGDSYAKKFEAGDYYEIVFTGVDAEGEPIIDEKENELQVVVPVVDYRDGKSVIFDKWTKVDLSALRGIDAVRISAKSSDVSCGFMNTPAYIAIDNISLTMYPNQK
ncbi:MAG: DUF4465 domain-containing protein [Bacteroidia bacterium]|nr:DUF4465 domain-containing protein [Bacteroidia bacterium]